MPELPRRRWSPSDPLVYSGIVVTATGLVGAVPGFMLLGAPPTKQCGSRGCVTEVDAGTRRRTAALLAGSGALLAVGVPALVAGASGEPPAAGDRLSPRAAMFGAWLTGYGAGAAAFGFTVAAAGRPSPSNNDGAVGLGMGITGLTMMAIGVPMWAIGTRPVEPAKRTPELLSRARSPGRMNVGLTLTSLGVVALASGMMSSVDSLSERGDFAGYSILAAGLPLMGLGTVLISVGLPLWLTGSGPGDLDPGALLPAVAVGPSGATLAWKLP